MIPKVIIEGQKYRKKVVEKYYNGELSEEVDSDNQLREIEFTKEFSSAKERTNYALLKVYEEAGYSAFVKTCNSLLFKSSLQRDDYSEMKGELAEVYLYITITEFINKFKLPWEVHHSLIIKKPEGEKGSTECDVVLISEEMIVVFEAKSYNGDKKISDICTVSVNNRTRDIYKQNALHCRSLVHQLERFALSGKYGMKSVMFSYATGSIDDTRTIENKRLIPIVTENSLLSFLTSVSKLSQKFWSSGIFDHVESLVGLISPEEHLSYVKSLNIDHSQ